MATDRTPGDFGRKLREARERRGLTLRQISTATKISMSALEALEHNDFARLPAGIFTRAFVRSYALQVGLEPDSTVREFVEQGPHDAAAAVPLTPSSVDDHERIESDRRIANAFVRLLVISVPIVGVVLYFSAAGVPPPSSSGAAPASGAEPDLPPPAATAGPDALPVSVPLIIEPAPPPPAAAAGQLVVTLEALAPCWVSTTVDGERTVARLLQPGDRQTIDIRRELVLTAGDAAALRVLLNGRVARPFGTAGEVVTRRLTPANFMDYLSQ
jgi:cytoskeleton protein RodZ